MAKHILILGAYGLIGSAIARSLLRAGHKITGVGRNAQTARRILPDVSWHIVDLTTQSTADWVALTQDTDIVINAAGALQDRRSDNLTAIHEDMIANLVPALEQNNVRFIQISAAGAVKNAPTDFMASKASGDARIAASQLDYAILRPSLVIGDQTFGGSALLRAAAALPVGLMMFKTATYNVIGLSDLAQCVLDVVDRRVPTPIIADVSNATGYTFEDLLCHMRHWQGFAPTRATVPIPKCAIWPVSKVADALGWLGWRSPLRTTAVSVLSEGIDADTNVWAQSGGHTPADLKAVLDDTPASIADRWFAKLYFWMPICVGVLSVFWILSGVIGAVKYSEAMALLTDRGTPMIWAALAVFGGAVADILLGLFVLYRPWAKRACLGMIAVSLAYLIGGSLFAADLWLDPLGSLVKVIPSILLTCLTMILLEDR